MHFHCGERKGKVAISGELGYSCLLSKFEALTCTSRFEHKITGESVYKQPWDPRGGILADDMGLGKTLTCLALIVASIPAAQSFGIGKGCQAYQVNQRPPVKATLVIAPLSCENANMHGFDPN